MLPDNLKGEWIWTKEADTGTGQAFFRREFVLSETPASAELWVSARNLFHIYVNGRHFGYGPVPSSNEDSYAMYFDITYLLSTGTNIIAIRGYNTFVTQHGRRRKPSGVWCQVNIDDHPYIWTDLDWLCHAPACIGRNRPRQSIYRGFTECVDMRLYAENWLLEGFAGNGWERPDIRQEHHSARARLLSDRLPETYSAVCEVEKIAVKGACHLDCAGTEVNTANLASQAGAGVYAAETFLYVSDEQKISGLVYADDPYRLFVNDSCAKEQAIPDLAPGQDPYVHAPPCYGQGERCPAEATIAARSGWNRILLCKQTNHDTAGVSLVFPGKNESDLVFRVEPDTNADEGWSVFGPLRTPLAWTDDTITCNKDNKQIFTPGVASPVDESAHLLRYTFEPGSEPEAGETARLLPMTMERGDYTVFDLGKIQYGCVQIAVSGNPGDMVDVVAGVRVEKGRVPPCEEGQRNVNTLILDSKSAEWTFTEPVCARYIMVVARQAGTQIQLENAELLRLHYAYENPGYFDCSDKVLRSIWNTSADTLGTCFQGQFLDAADTRPVQSIASAMAQSWAAYHILGSYAVVERNIGDFSAGRLETGAIPSISNTDCLAFASDQALLWPVWVRRHFQYTGNRDFLEKAVPVVNALLEHFSVLANPDTGMLTEKAFVHGQLPFIDYNRVEKTGAMTALNALYCRALVCAAWLCDQSEEDADSMAQAWRKKASGVASAVRAANWDPDKRLFADYSVDGKRSDRCSMQSNILAIYGGLAIEDTYNEIFEKCFSDGPPCEGDDQHSHDMYFKYFTLETAFALGRREWAIDLIKQIWGGMLDAGCSTWWQFFDPAKDDSPPNKGSLCYGMAAYAAPFLATEVAGLRPATPGFTRVFFEPMVGKVDWANLIVPTVRGHLRAEWSLNEKRELDVSLDANFPVEVVVNLDPARSETASFHISNEITILPAETVEC